MNRREAREAAFKLLFQMELNDQEPVLTETEGRNSYIDTVIKGIKETKSELDMNIAQHLRHWTLERIAIVDKTILRMAVYEILHIEDIPKAVSINEAVELAHTYGDEKSASFINGVLSNIN